MRMNGISRDEIREDRIVRLTERFPDLRSSDAQESLATGERWGIGLRALVERVRRIKWVWRGRRPEVVTVFVEDLRV